jgi:feruloyl-CoA synthase
VVLAGLNRDDIGALIFPRLDDAKKRFGLAAETTPAQVLAHPEVRGFYQALIDRLWAEGTGSANRVARALLLDEPPLIDRGEVTDKGSINQRAVLANRAALVERLYVDVPDAQVILPRR